MGGDRRRWSRAWEEKVGIEVWSVPGGRRWEVVGRCGSVAVALVRPRERGFS